jgi:hypothetical protein
VQAFPHYTVKTYADAEAPADAEPLTEWSSNSGGFPNGWPYGVTVLARNALDTPGAVLARIWEGEDTAGKPIEQFTAGAERNAGNAASRLGRPA